MKIKIFKNEKFLVIVLFAVLSAVLTWPVAAHFFSSVPSSGADTMQVIGVAGYKANTLSDQGLIKGALTLAKQSEFNITLLYAYFQLIFGRIAGYNLLFFLSFILSGFGAYLLADYFTKDKRASILAGIIFAFSPFHFHMALGTNVGTMHQEWLPFFALYLFKFFDDLRLRNFTLAGLFLLLIGFTEHQLLAFTVIFIIFFLVYKLVAEPKKFLRWKFWAYIIVSALVLSVIFFFMFRSLLKIANSGNNYLDAGFRSAVNYSNDSLSILIPPAFHSLWPNSFMDLRNQFRRANDSQFTVYAGYSILLLSLVGIFGYWSLKRKKLPTRGIFLWFAVAAGFYVLSLGPYLHYKGILDPPIQMPYMLIYKYIPFYNNIRTVGRFFVWSMLGFSVLAAWGSAFLGAALNKTKKTVQQAVQKNGTENSESKQRIAKKAKVFYVLAGLVIILEFLAVPLETNSLAHSSFYETLGKDKENYSILEVPGSTSYDFASRDLVWKSIHRKQTINGYDFARVVDDHFAFQRGTPIIHTLLYDIPEGSNGSDRDIMKNSYYDISNEIMNYYNIRYITLDKEGLKGKPEKGDPNMIYPAKAYIANVLKCSEEYEDAYLYACKIDQSIRPEHMFLAMDYANKHWVGKSKSKNGFQRWAENGAGLKLVNMSPSPKNGKLSFNLKIEKPLRLKVIFNGEEVFNKYFTNIGQKQEVSTDLANIKPGENDVNFGVLAADGSEIRSDKKSDTVRIYQVQAE